MAHSSRPASGVEAASPNVAQYVVAVTLCRCSTCAAKERYHRPQT